MDEASLNFITCACWVPKGAAKSNPEKVEISKEDLARIIKETGDEVKDLEDDEENAEKETGMDDEEIEDDDAEESSKENATSASMDVDMKENGGESSTTEDKDNVSRKNDDALDFESKYIMDNYEREPEPESMNKLLQLGQLSIHASSQEDPYISVKDEDDVDSENEDHVILPSDNLIAVGHVEGDAAILEVYIHNSEQESFYVHHDILLPSIPLCMEWLNYDPTDQQLKPGNMMAIGSMSPEIEVWDLDLIDCLEPAYKLGKKAKKKKKVAGVGHKDAVLSLAWNSHAEHVLASGSVDETVILWDIQYGRVAQQLTSFKEKIQALQWHHTESHSLLTGCCDNIVRLFDCNDSNSYKSWELNGEIECITWNKHSGNPYFCLASTDKGTVYGIDCRQEEPLWKLDAHTDGCTGLQLSPECPGCLVTASVDGSMKVWDLNEENPKLVTTKYPNIGILNSLSTNPNQPFVFCMGGDKKDENLKVLDIRESLKVRRTFCSRVNLPIDDEEGVESDDEDSNRMKKKKKRAQQKANAAAQENSNSYPNANPSVVLLNSDENSKTTGSKPKSGKNKKGRHPPPKRLR